MPSNRSIIPIVKCPVCGGETIAKKHEINFDIMMDKTSILQKWEGDFYCWNCLLEIHLVGKLPAKEASE